MTQRIEYTEEMVGNAHPTKADTLNRLVNLFTAQGDILYGTAAATAAALAKGAANLKMFMNAGATAPEWAAGVKITTFTRDLELATADGQYWGVGFKPSMIIVIAFMSVSFQFSVGFSDPDKLNWAMFNYAADTMYGGTYLVAGSTSAGNENGAIVKSYDADGSTWTWTKVGTPTGTLVGYILNFR